MAEEDGQSQERVNCVRSQFDGMIWSMGQEVEARGVGGEGSFVVDSIGKWLGRSASCELSRRTQYTVLLTPFPDLRLNSASF